MYFVFSLRRRLEFEYIGYVSNFHLFPDPYRTFGVNANPNLQNRNGCSCWHGQLYSTISSSTWKWHCQPHHFAGEASLLRAILNPNKEEVPEGLTFPVSALGTTCLVKPCLRHIHDHWKRALKFSSMWNAVFWEQVPQWWGARKFFFHLAEVSCLLMVDLRTPNQTDRRYEPWSGEVQALPCVWELRSWSQRFLESPRAICRPLFPAESQLGRNWGIPCTLRGNMHRQEGTNKLPCISATLNTQRSRQYFRWVVTKGGQNWRWRLFLQLGRQIEAHDCPVLLWWAARFAMTRLPNRT